VSTYKINVTPSAQQFINLLPQEVETDLNGWEYPVDFGVLGEHDIPLYDVSVNLRQEVQNFFGSMDYTLDDVEAEVSVSDLVEACQDENGLSSAEAAAQIIAEVMEWLQCDVADAVSNAVAHLERDVVERQRASIKLNEDYAELLKEQDALQIEMANLRAVLKAAALD
jgi:hypothetical protein